MYKSLALESSRQVKSGVSVGFGVPSRPFGKYGKIPDRTKDLQVVDLHLLRYGRRHVIS